ncbi:hypothetical protein CCMSSC00406_0005036 [Pleurotus cornucopiae]|uniref:Uncharacterized protein n=1 Tax=Pleurotus cornucopiae TaxID=5321 RepID=A0ACB7J7Y6_PLECO|nr:hypothetical protein CCMSSC00406_0005036 [Pleurotus cornucopiae]
METGSNAPELSPEFDFWEFVACAKCYLPFISHSGPSVPFWLTECGHVLLGSDQSCPQCRSPKIQLIPLQADMEAPMADWFRAIPNSLETIAYASKFQQETMAAQIRHLKSKVLQYRGIVEQLRREVAELQRANQHLSRQDTLDSMSSHPTHGYEPSGLQNINGKRRMIDPTQKQQSASSPLMEPPPGPNRLTLPHRRAPTLSTNGESHSSPSAQQRPGTRSFTKHYAYDPPSTGKGRSQDQAAPDSNNGGHEFQGFPQQGGQRFKALIPPSRRQRPDVPQGSHTQAPQPGPAPRFMGPPPTPRHLDRTAGMRPPPSSRRNIPGLFKPSVPQDEQPHHYGRPTNAPQRFLPGSGNSRPQQFTENGRSQANGASETRIPFMPGTHGSSFG